jgi:hypothetical protein
MRRVVATHIGTRDRWVSRVSARSDVPIDIIRGLDAYAHRQANVYESLAISFVNLWSPELRKNNISVDWPSELAEHAKPVDVPPKRKSGRQKAKATYMSESESEGDAIGGEDAIDGEDTIVPTELDGESVLLNLAGYADSEYSEEDTL